MHPSTEVGFHLQGVDEGVDSSRFGEVLPSVLDDLRPNILANYLLDLAKAFHSFFEACPGLKSEGEVRKSRLVLCELTARVLEKGLGLLGINVPERM